MLKLSAAIALLLVGCTSTTSTISTQPAEPSPSPSSTEIAVPAAESCHRNYVSVKLDTFNDCILLGMPYLQVANILGYQGEKLSESGNSQTWQWNGRSGTMMAVFTDNKLVSKSQSGLE